MPTTQCIARESLKQYLSGWSDPQESAVIEMHLLDCPECEQTIVELEANPDTLVAFLQSSPVGQSAENPSEGSEQQANGKLDGVVAYALSRSKQLASAKQFPEQLGDSSSDQPILKSGGVAASRPANIGPYELLSPLGHGGMGTVYLARHRQLGKQVAIKLLPLRAFRNDHYVARFQREIRAAGKLNHSAIVAATDAGNDAGTHYLVMEHIDGLDLNQIAKAIGTLDVADACAVVRAVALGLSHAHAEGIVHRDIKPSNLMLSASQQVKILDFGLAQVGLWDEVSAELTTVGQLMGTLDYMAPEQAERPDSVDYRVDLYSLGATLFRLLTGRAPLAVTPNLSPLAKLRLLATHEAPNLNTLRPDAPEELTGLVASLLARDPEARPASAAHVAELLELLAAGADLASLLSLARDRMAALQDEELLSGDSLDDEFSTGSLIPVTASQFASTQAARASSGAGRSANGRGRRWFLAASALPFLLLAGVWIILEMQKGQLIIESTDANVEVQLAKDGKTYKTLHIAPGANATRLYAGKYEIRIDAASDRFEVDQNSIAIKRGDTTIARLRHKSLTPENDPFSDDPFSEDSNSNDPFGGSNSDASSRTDGFEPGATAKSGDSSDPFASELPADSVDRDEATYNGKRYSYWISIFLKERNWKMVVEALEALASFVNKENSKQIAHALVARGRMDQGSGVDSWRFFIALRGTQPSDEAFIELCIKELEHADEKWGSYLVYHALRGLSPNVNANQRIACIDRFNAWIEENVFQSKKRPDLLPSAVVCFADQLTSIRLDVQRQSRLAKNLIEDKQTDFDFWFRYFQNPSHALSQSIGEKPSVHAKLAEVFQSKAIDALANDSTPLKQVAEAVLMLNILQRTAKEGSYNPWGIPANTDEMEFHPVLSQRLKDLAHDPQSQFYVYPMDQGLGGSSGVGREAMSFEAKLPYSGSSLLSLFSGRLNSEAHIGFQLSSNPLLCVIGVEVLDLIQRLDRTPQFSDDIKAIARACAPMAIEIAVKLSPHDEAVDKRANKHLFENVQTYYTSLEWPSLTWHTEWPARLHDMKPQDPTTQEWVGHLIFERALSLLSEEERKEILDEQLPILKERWDQQRASRPPTADVQAQPTADESVAVSEPATTEPAKDADSKEVAPAAPDAKSTEAVYDGKPYSHWIDLLAHEHNPETFETALVAVSCLLSPENREEVTRVLLARKSAWIQNPSRFFYTLKSAQPNAKAFYELCTRELEQSDEAWGGKILDNVPMYNSVPDTSEAVESYFGWIEQNVIRSDKRPELWQKAVDLFVKTLEIERFSPELQSKLVAALQADKRLGLDFWSYPVPPRINFSWDHLNRKLAAAAEAKAIEAIANESTSEDDVTRGVLMLNFLNSGNFNRRGMQSLKPDAAFKDAITRHIEALLKQPERLFGAVDVDQSNPMYRIGQSDDINSALVMSWSKGKFEFGLVSHTPHDCILACQLLILIQKLGIQSDFEKQIEALAGATLQPAAEFLGSVISGEAQFSTHASSSTGKVITHATLHLPGLTWVAPVEFGRVRSPSKEQFFGHLIFERALTLLPERTEKELLERQSVALADTKAHKE